MKTKLKDYVTGRIIYNLLELHRRCCEECKAEEALKVTSQILKLVKKTEEKVIEIEKG